MTRLQYEVDVIDSPWGEGVNLDILKRKLQADHRQQIKAVCVVHSETATGVTTNLADIRQILGTVLILYSRLSSICFLLLTNTYHVLHWIR